MSASVFSNEHGEANESGVAGFVHVWPLFYLMVLKPSGPGKTTVGVACLALQISKHLE